MREKAYGIWQTWTLGQLCEESFALAAGLSDLGFARNDTLVIIGDNRPRLYGSMIAARALGGVPVPAYQDSVAEEIQYVVDHARGALHHRGKPGASRQGPGDSGSRAQELSASFIVIPRVCANTIRRL